jgi:hypothetical protein
MTYQVYSDHIKLCAYLGKEPQGEFKEYYDFITGMWRDMEFSVINVHNEQSNGHTIILHKGTDFYMEQDFKNGYLECHWDRVWSFFRTTKGMELRETHDFIRGMVEKHLKCKVSRPKGCTWYMSGLVEKHLKCKVSRPLLVLHPVKYLVEEQLKCNNT